MPAPIRTTLPEPSTPATAQPWGLRDALLGWGAAVVMGAVVGAIIIGVAGYAGSKAEELPLWLIAITQVPLWTGLLGAPLLAARRARGTLAGEFGFTIRPVDVPVGIVVGVVGQFVVVPLISWPWLELLGKSAHDLGQVAEQLVSKANDPIGVVLLILIVAIGAPIVEELFYRGLFLRSLQQVVPVWAAIVLCGLGFGASHFEVLALPALSTFGMLLAWLTWRTKRLGPAIMAHLTFNSLTVWYLLR